jgi:ABC-type lipoprotein release transport system permease subunit
VAGRVLSSLLYGVSPRDPFVLFGAVVVPVVVAAIASYLPARRASRVDPVIALRHE